ncbi:unnamed protein product [Chilo suppressalis]|uniref:Peptidyl-prolyl cis-trans isomerase n=1 Tax=Chilo suppressalis TaxID=168631 RepID=A0ABN8B2T9_CHISP|nr:unnamed protein product [Chilo suppressalis]
MAVVIETTLGDITVDLYLEQRPVTCLNFLKLCKMKYYNFNLFHTIRSGFIAQTGDPSGEGSGGQSIFGLLEGPEKRFFSGEKMPKIRHTNAGLLSMVCSDDMMVGSQFFFTLASDLDSLDGVHCVIGEVAEGHEVLRKLNEVICDETHRPYQDVRVTHTVILEDPFNDPPGFRSPSRSPSPSAERLKGGRIAPDEEIDETQGRTAAEIQEIIEEKEAKARATILEIVGDLPDADIAPPENVLFVCKLNPVTTDEDLEIIFSRFGKIVSCEVIRDKKTGDSLQYAFIEFSDKKSCEDAYFKMDNVLIDDRRIHVDFSQSVSKMRYLGKGRGVQHLDDDGNVKGNHFKSNQDKERYRYHPNRQSDREKYHNSKCDDEKYKEKEDRKTQSTGHSSKTRQDRHNDKHHYNKDRGVDNYERKKKYENEKRSRGRSRSEEKSMSKSEKFRSRSDNHKNNDSMSSSRQYDTSQSHKKSKSDRIHSDRQREREKSTSPSKNTKDKADKKCEESEQNENRKRKNSSHNNVTKHQTSNSSDNLKNKKSKNQNEELDKKHDRRRDRVNDKHVEPRTPSPAKEKKQRKDKKILKHVEKNKKHSKRELNKKKKRKPSTSSSESESSDSSSSSTETSSSDSDTRKKKRSRRKRKHSTSSSSESSDSSSSSSSSDSSSSTSSSSDSERNRKRARKTKKKVVKKNKKKT